MFDFRREMRRSHRRRWIAPLKMVAGGLAGGALLGICLLYWPTFTSSLSAEPPSAQFSVCGMVRRTCEIDGDTFWFLGEKVRIADIDTPEISEPRCEWEYNRGIEARDRLVALLNEGPFDMQPIGDRDEDKYGRKLRVVTRDGSSLGDQLASEGLARTWTGRREPWC